MDCLPTYKGKKYNSIAELIEENNLQGSIFDIYQKYLSKDHTEPEISSSGSEGIEPTSNQEGDSESEAIDTKNPKDYTNHSGGAALSDTEWDQIGREFGVTNHKHYREPLQYIDTKGQPGKGSLELDSRKLQEAKIKPTHITQEEYNEGAIKATEAFRMMYTDGAGKSVRSAYIIRNWLQVKNADAIYALGTIKQPGENASDKVGETRIAAIPIVKGGTGYAVQMAINEGKPVYIFDGTKEGWYQYDYETKNFTPTETPTLTRNFAGIGSRSLSTPEVINKSLQAIRDVYTKTFQSSEEFNSRYNTPTEVKPGVSELFDSNLELANAIYSKILTNSGISAENLLSLLLKDNLIEKQCL